MRHPVLALAFLLASAPLAAQGEAAPRAPEAGARVRVSLLAPPPERMVGRLRLLSPDTLVVGLGGGQADLSLPLASVASLERSRGRPRLLWTVLGTVAGAGAGVLAHRATREDDPADIGGLRGTADGLEKTLVGALAGGVLGFVLAPERWSRVPLPGR